jgi:hypothetical protein
VDYVAPLSFRSSVSGAERDGALMCRTTWQYPTASTRSPKLACSRGALGPDVPEAAQTRTESCPAAKFWILPITGTARSWSL